MKLNLGCGDRLIEGYTNVDFYDADVTHDLLITPWPFNDESADEILASHIIEHFDKQDGYRFLSECWRVLKPGGILHIAVPDLDKFIQSKVTGDETILGPYHWQDMNHLGGGDESEQRKGYRHRQFYCWESLAYMLIEMGFDPIRRPGPREFDTPAHAIFSLYIDALK